jgi:hypothetical protein
MQAEADQTERLAVLLERCGWRVVCFDPLEPAHDWDGADFVLIGDRCSAMSIEAARWFDRLMAEIPSAYYH